MGEDVPGGILQIKASFWGSSGKVGEKGDRRPETGEVGKASSGVSFPSLERRGPATQEPGGGMS